MTTDPRPQNRAPGLHLAVALDGAGWHPVAWREGRVSPAALFSPDYWIDQVAVAERGLLDFVTIEDSLSIHTAHRSREDDPIDQVLGRLDAVQLAARVAPETSRIGLVASTNVLEAEPFHLATRLATLDYASTGRAGWQVQAGPLDETVDVIDTVRRLWDSWEDDAIIRDVATGRFLDRRKLHPVEIETARYSIAGPSITPRPPQGQPLVTALAHSTEPYRLAVRGADVVFVTPLDRVHAEAVVGEIRSIEAQLGRTTHPGAEPLRILADVVVVIDETVAAAEERLLNWDALAGTTLTSDAAIVAGSAESIADLLEDWRDVGIDGFRLRPASVHLDLPAIADGLVPELQRRGVFRTAYDDPDTGTLRELLGLDRPANRFAA